MGTFGESEELRRLHEQMLGGGKEAKDLGSAAAKNEGEIKEQKEKFSQLSDMVLAEVFASVAGHEKFGKAYGGKREEKAKRFEDDKIAIGAKFLAAMSEEKLDEMEWKKADLEEKVKKFMLEEIKAGILKDRGVRFKEIIGEVCEKAGSVAVSELEPVPEPIPERKDPKGRIKTVKELYEDLDFANIKTKAALIAYLDSFDTLKAEPHPEVEGAFAQSWSSGYIKKIQDVLRQEKIEQGAIAELALPGPLRKKVEEVLNSSGPAKKDGVQVESKDINTGKGRIDYLKARALEALDNVFDVKKLTLRDIDKINNWLEKELDFKKYKINHESAEEANKEILAKVTAKKKELRDFLKEHKREIDKLKKAKLEIQLEEHEMRVLKEEAEKALLKLEARYDEEGYFKGWGKQRKDKFLKEKVGAFLEIILKEDFGFSEDNAFKNAEQILNRLFGA